MYIYSFLCTARYGQQNFTFRLHIKCDFFDFNLNLKAECPNFWVWLWSSRGLELKLEQKNELLGNFFKVTDRTGNVWEVWHSSVTKINCHHFTMVARTCASRVASLPSVDVARSESGELSKDGHRPSKNLNKTIETTFETILIIVISHH